MIELDSRTMLLARPGDLPPPTVAEAIDAYLDEIAAARSPATCATYASALRRLAEYFASAGVPPDRTLTVALPTHTLEAFYVALVRHYGREKQTAHTLAAAARSFVRWLFAREIGPAGTTFEGVRLRLAELGGPIPFRTPRPDGGLPRVVLVAEAAPRPDSRLAWLALLRDRALLRTLWTTALRRAEVCSLDRADLDDGRRDQALIVGKGRRERVVFFDEPTLAAIRAYLEARNDRYRPLFLRHNRALGKPGPGGVNLRLSPQSVWLAVKKYAALAGVPATTHDFRHAKASVMLNRGADLSTVQDILGHASPEITKRIYAHYAVAKLRQAFDDYSADPEELADVELEVPA